MGLAAGLGLAPAPPVAACNACLEDKIAATYDWQVAAAAQRRGHTVVFLALVGPVTPGDDALARRIAHRLAATPGVDAGTVRVALAPPAVSVAGDLRRHAVTDLVASMNERLRPEGLRLTVVRVGSPGEPATTASFTR
jgi:hypothetical protein